MRTIFSADGPVMRAMTDLMNLVILNLITLLCCIPIVTAGAALASMHYILMQMVEGKEGRILATFWKQFKGNLRSATLPWIVLLVSAGILFVDFRIFHGEEGPNRVLVILLYLAVLIWAMLYVWLFPLLARFDNTFVGTFRNAFMLAVGYLPRTLGMVAFTAVIPFLLTQVTRLLPLAFFVGISLPAYFCMLLYHKVIAEMVKRAGGGEAEEDEQTEEGNLTTENE